MTRLLLGCAIALASGLGSAAMAEPRAEHARDCTTVSECIDNLVQTATQPFGVWWDANAEIAEVLKARFGEEARDALLDLAGEESKEKRNLAGGILSEWGDWRPEDTPRLRAALARSPNGWIARPLGEIGDEAAIDALVANLKRARGPGQTTWALSQIGPGVLGRILPALETPSGPDGRRVDGAEARAAETVIRDFGADAAGIAPDWAALATDPAAAMARRLAALRGLAAIGAHARPLAPGLRPLLSSGNPALAYESYRALAALGDETVAARVLADCLEEIRQGGAPDFAQWCLADLGAFSPADGRAGALAAPFLDDPSAPVRTAAIYALGDLVHRAAAGAIADHLGAADWREAVAAIQALDQLEHRAGRAALAEVAESHWWPAVRDLAADAVRSLDGAGAPVHDRDEDPEILLSSRSAYFLTTPPPDCPSGRWVWDAEAFGFTDAAYRPEQIVAFGDGALVGTDDGEWGGTLVWRPDSGGVQTLWQDNIARILRSPNGALIVSSSSHLLSSGYLFRAIRNAGGWDTAYLGELPDDVDGHAELADGKHAVLSGGWPVVFSPGGIEGVAACAE